MATSTLLQDLIPFARAFLGDMDSTKYSFTDDTILNVLRVTTAILKILGYDAGHNSDAVQVAPPLVDYQQALWGKCAAVLLLDPQALKTGMEAVSVSTLGTRYSTDARAKFVGAASTRAFAELKQMIRALSDSFKVTTDKLDIDTLP